MKLGYFVFFDTNFCAVENFCEKKFHYEDYQMPTNIHKDRNKKVKCHEVPKTCTWSFIDDFQY